MGNYYEHEISGKALDAISQGVNMLSPRNRELIPNLKAQRAELMARVQKIDTLMVLLEKNPEFVKMLDLTRELI